MSGELFTLTWSEFPAWSPRTLRRIWEERQFTDVTLATEDGGTVTAHRAILSASSPLLRRLLQEHPHPHPLLLLPDTPLSTLSSLLTFIYTGQASLQQEEINTFMVAGTKRQVEG